MNEEFIEEAQRVSGFFTMDFLNEIQGCDHKTMKERACAKIAEVTAKHKVKAENVAKAKRMIDSSKNAKSLVIAIGDFILSHDHGLKVISNAKK